MGQGYSGRGGNERAQSAAGEQRTANQSLLNRASSATWRTFQYQNALTRATSRWNARMGELRPSDFGQIREGQLSTTNERLRRAQEAERAMNAANARVERAAAIERSIDRQLYRRQRMEDMRDIIASGERSASQIGRIAGARAERRYRNRRSRRR